MSQIYRLSGLTCTDCAAKLERELNDLPGVARAKINFGAAKLTIEGNPDPAQVIRLAKEVDDVIATPEGEEQQSHARAELSRGGIALALLVAGLVTGQTLFYVLTIIVGGYATAKKGLRSLRRLKFDTDVLMLIAVIGAGLIGEWQEAAVVAFLFNVSEYLEAQSLERARGAIKQLMALAPKHVNVLTEAGEVSTPLEAVRPGQRIRVRPGEQIGLDGRVVKGASAVNQATITGESLPVPKQFDDEVFAGTLNGEGFLEIEVTKPASDSTLAKIIHLVEEAQAQKAPAERFVDRFAAVYTPIILILAALTIAVPPLLLGQPWEPWLYQGLALLVIACPCALVVSTPVSLVAGIGAGARQGVLIKGGLYLEQAAQLKAIAFDKTGTLTEGRPQVTDVIALTERLDQAGVLEVAAALEGPSEHPLARAVVNAFGGDGPEVTEFWSHPGLGVSGSVGGTAYRLGSPRFLEAEGLPAVAELEREGKTVMVLGDGAGPVGLIAVADQLRAESVAALAELRRLGVAHTVMLTGDNRRTAAAIAEQAGVAAFEAELLPEQKVEAVQRLRARHGQVGMVGDGVNDAPALAVASLGIAMGGAGSDVALETADVALMGDDLSKLPFLVKLSRKTLGVIKQNITIALGLKLIAVLAVIPGWLTLWLAIIADMGATLLVTLNGIRLLRERP